MGLTWVLGGGVMISELDVFDYSEIYTDGLYFYCKTYISRNEWDINI